MSADGAAALDPHRELPGMTVQLNTRVSARTRRLLEANKALNDISVKQGVERAIESMYGHLIPPA